MQQGLTDEHYRHVASYRDREVYTEREKLAIEYAERFALDHLAIDGEFFDRLRAQYSDAEILELTTTIGYCMGMGRVLAVLDIANDCEVNFTPEPRIRDHA